MLFCFNAGEVFQLAIDMEGNGIGFYEKAQKLIEDAEVKELFSLLIQENREHKRYFEELKADLPGELVRPTVSDLDNELDAYLKAMADQHVFNDVDKLNAQLAEARTVADAVKLALQCEKDCVIFYLSMLDATCEGKARDLVNLLIKEKQEHVRRLSLQFQKCSEVGNECLLSWPA